MEKLISELIRLYCAAGQPSRDVLAQRLLGQGDPAVRLASHDGATRAIVIAFPRTADGEQARHWSRLCLVANALQTELGLTAPAVSIAGAGYGLWLSLEQPIPSARARTFLALLGKAYLPDMEADTGAAATPAALPPCMIANGDKWAAFIHPDLGASFSDEPWLDMAPPFAGQAALLEGLHSNGAAQFQRALDKLEQAHDAASAAGDPAPGTPMTTRVAAAEGLLLKDATLEDIVRFLHAKNIEPTFRHVIG